MREGGKGYQGTAVRNWGVVCAGTDGRKGKDKVGVT